MQKELGKLKKEFETQMSKVADFLALEELEQKFEVFPGQIKVTIIREYRTEATTKI